MFRILVYRLKVSKKKIYWLYHINFFTKKLVFVEWLDETFWFKYVVKKFENMLYLYQFIGYLLSLVMNWVKLFCSSLCSIKWLSAKKLVTMHSKARCCPMCHLKGEHWRENTEGRILKEEHSSFPIQSIKKILKALENSKKISYHRKNWLKYRTAKIYYTRRDRTQLSLIKPGPLHQGDTFRVIVLYERLICKTNFFHALFRGFEEKELFENHLSRTYQLF